MFALPGLASQGRDRANSINKTCAVSGCGQPRTFKAYCKDHQNGGQDTSSKNVPKPKASSGLATRWWEKKEEVHTVWQHCVTNDGLDYYYNTETKETTWEKPEELMSPDEIDSKGEWMWVPDPVHCFVPGKVIAKNATQATLSLEDGQERTVKSSLISQLKRSSLQRIVADLVLLDDMNPPLILHNLKKRFEQEKIYTNVGTILISVNPYRMLPLYDKATTRTYINRKTGQEMPPHVFNIAHDSFWGLKEFHQNQSIIISGESGAGKTEATKQCLAYLAASAGSVAGIEKKVLQANPILEAFGNAKTLRNDNSSRFGKYMEVYFNQQNRICGSSTKNYLLEKIRVCSQQSNERNFHIFYQLTKAASSGLRSKLDLEAPSNYRYLQTCTDVETINDESDFTEVQQAFKDLSFSSNDTDFLLSTVAAVVSMGNLVFSGSGGSQKTQLKQDKYAGIVAKLLQVDVQKLVTALTIRELRIRGQETTYVNLSAKDAGDTRDALAKFVYGKMFDWLVLRVNKAMGSNSDTSRYIGILDIFGFEIFEQNSFEQLCINFTNEMLQQHFNNQTFKLEEAVYKSECIKFTHISFIDNQPMLELITKRPVGILPLLDEELVVPRGSDTTFLGKLNEHQAKNPVYKKVMRQPTNFVIKHYAGDVEYDTFGFLEKNRDTLTTDLLEMLYTSTSPYIQALFPSDQQLSTKEKKSSLSKQFQAQLNALMATLNKTEPHYIRCVKPNHTKSAITFISQIVFEQLTYSGVFEAVAIRKQGFPFRLKHDLFADRYSVIFTDGKQVMSGDKRTVCTDVIQNMKLDADNVQMGKSMVLYRAEEHKKLELHRSIKVQKIEIVDNLAKLLRTDPNSLSEAEKEQYFMDLARGVNEADKFRLEDESCRRARAALEKYIEERMDPQTKRLLQEAHDTMDIDKLERVLDICDEKGYATKLTRKCRELLEQVTDAEAALNVAKQEKNIEYLEQALAMCDAFNYNVPSVQEARTLLSNIKKALEMLASVKKSLNHEHMKKCLVFCSSFQFHTAAVEEVAALYKKVLHGRQLCSEAMSAVKQELLEEAVRYCDRLKYSSSLVEDCRSLCRRVTRINEEATKAKHTLLEEHCKVVVKAAEEIKMSTKTLKELRKLVKGPKAEFLKAQFDRARELGDNQRAIFVDIKRKDLLVEEKGGALDLGRYVKLKDSTQWAKEKFWGDSVKRAAGMLSFQRQTLHSNMTQMSCADPKHLKFLKSKINQNFESVQKYMSQRNSSKLDKRIADLLSDSLENAEIRDEVYISLMKQIDSNPEPEAIPPAWELLALCLIVFPPSKEFENHLEKFCRANPEMNSKYSLSGLLRRRALEGCLKATLTKESFGGPQQSQVKSVVQKYVADNTPSTFQPPKPKRVTWKDISRSFLDGVPDDLPEEKENAAPSSRRKTKGSRRETTSRRKTVAKEKESAPVSAPVPATSEESASVSIAAGEAAPSSRRKTRHDTDNNGEEKEKMRKKKKSSRHGSEKKKKRKKKQTEAEP
eukprot:CAMPEP_0175129960 /NCGR_PEP_ID=MMETSP0087-20121206/5753_1 /TAXON_ID=136419 /ORGANISM="Unknown Unknown, Strain D1" /LENGTH=1504 /DNA_ID=CAMNT_0016412149 /DNA_START=25 /DNA_END=4539 /DNA_ORIENTATION=-